MVGGAVVGAAVVGAWVCAVAAAVVGEPEAGATVVAPFAAVVADPAAGAVVEALAAAFAVVAEPEAGAVVDADPEPDPPAAVVDAVVVGASLVPTFFELPPHAATPTAMIATPTSGATRRRTLLPAVVPIWVKSLTFLVCSPESRVVYDRNPVRDLSIAENLPTTTAFPRMEPAPRTRTCGAGPNGT